MAHIRNASASLPSPSFGYYRGAPQFMGEGSGIGGTMAGVGKMPAGQGASPANSTSAWHPTILYLFGLLIVEFIALGLISRLI